MRRILLPGFMPNLGDHERLDLLPENKALYDFWLDTTRDRSYFQYVKECAAVCVCIFDRYAEESFELVGHSTGCTVILDRIFSIPDLYTERIAKVTLLCPAVFIYFPNGFIPIHATLTTNSLTTTLFSWLSRVPLSLPKQAVVPSYLFPDAPSDNSPLTIRLAELTSYLTAYASIHRCYREAIWSTFDTEVVLATNDYLVDNAAVVEWLPPSVTAMFMEGHHETPLR